MSDHRTPSKPRIAVGMLVNLGKRLQSDERPPYEVDEHDDIVSFDDPTGDVIAPVRKETAKKGEGT